MTDTVNGSRSRYGGMALLALTTLVAALLLVFFLPRDKKFGYEYEQ